MQSLPIANVTEQLQTILDLLNELNMRLPLTAEKLEVELERVRMDGPSLMDVANSTSKNVHQTASQQAHLECEC